MSNLDSVSFFHSLQTRLTLAVLATLAGAFALVGIMLGVAMNRDARSYVHGQQEVTVALLASQVELALEVRFRALEQVASELAHAPRWNPASAQALLRERPILTTLFNIDVLAVHPQGAVLAQWPRPAHPAWVVEQASALPAAERGDSASARWVWREEHGVHPTVLLGVPVRSPTGAVQGYLVGREQLGDAGFLHVLLGSTDPLPGIYAVLDGLEQAQGPRVLAQRAADDGASTSPQTPTPAPHWGEAVEAADPGGGWLWAQHPVRGTPWAVAARTRSASALAGLQQRQRDALWATFGIATLALLVCGWVIRRSMAPLSVAIGQLSRAAVDRVPRIASLDGARRDEVGVLIASFNHVLQAMHAREMALQQSRQRLDDILNHLDARVYLKDASGRYLFANHSLCVALGRPVQDVLGRCDADFFDAATSERLQANDAQVLQGAGSRSFDELIVPLGTHEARTFLSVKLPMRDVHGGVEAVCGISTDITERMRQEADLRIAAVAFEGGGEGMMVLDHAWQPMRVNRAFVAITGYDLQHSAAALGRLLDSGALAPTVRAHVEQALARDDHWHGRLRVRHPQGYGWCAKIGMGVVRTTQGQVSHIVVNVVDDTPAQQAEKLRLQQEATHRKALVREVHHRIKNNLQGILALLRQHGQRHPEVREPLHMAIGQIQSISLLHGLQGRQDRAQVHVGDLVDAISKEVGLLWSCELTVQPPPPWPDYLLSEHDSVSIALILHELMLNAAKHRTDAQAGVLVRLTPHAGTQTGVDIEVSNPGDWQCGIAAVAQGSGRGLMAALMPRYGADMVVQCRDAVVHVRLTLVAPVVVPAGVRPRNDEEGEVAYA